MKLYIGEALGLIKKTMPYVTARAGILALVGIGAVIYFGIIALLIGALKEAGGIAAIIFIIGTGGFILIMRFIKHAVLYALKAGHIAVLTELIDKGTLPEGKGQVEYGKDLVKSRFKDVAIMFAVDRLVAGVLRTFNRTVARVTDALPIPGLEGLGKLVTTLVNFSISFVDEAILSYAISREDDNLWKSSKDGVILYAQEWKAILPASAVMGLIDAAAFLVVFIPLLIILGFATGAGWIALVISAVIGYLVKEAFVRPWAMASIILTFRREIQGKTPNPEWDQRLESVSKKFRELKDKAVEYARGQGAEKPEEKVEQPPETPAPPPLPITEKEEKKQPEKAEETETSEEKKEPEKEDENKTSEPPPIPPGS